MWGVADGECPDPHTLVVRCFVATHQARMLLTSTSEVYGDPLVHPQVETYWGNVNPIGLRSCYDEGAWAVGVLCGVRVHWGFTCCCLWPP